MVMLVKRNCRDRGKHAGRLRNVIFTSVSVQICKLIIGPVLFCKYALGQILTKKLEFVFSDAILHAP